MSVYKKVHFGPNKTRTFLDENGLLHYQLLEEVKEYPHRFTDRLMHFASVKPQQAFLSKKNQEIWQSLTFSEAFSLVEKLSQVFIDFDFKRDEGLVILSENSIEHALVALAALHIGIPYSPISPPYSLVSNDFGKLRHCLSVMKPKVIFAQNGKTYSRAIQVAKEMFPNAIVVCAEESPEASFADLLETDVTEEVAEYHERVNRETPAKILFTSGSTGLPKGVTNTHGMWCASLQQITQALPFMADTPPVFVDWLPWNHTFGGNQNFGLTVYNGGTLYLDEGRPTARDMEKTIQNLRAISPTAYFNVPKGFEMLVAALEKEPDLRESFFKNLQILFYAGASMAQPIWDALERLAIETIGSKIPIITGLGCTEAGPSAMFANWGGAFSGLLGVPVAGLDIKLVPDGDKVEARYKGPNITVGYWKNGEATKASFDEEGYYCSGDAVKFLDPENTDKGMVFDGRIAEDFKLNTGTWVNVGILKAKVISKGSPIIQDVVLAGLDQAFVGAILFLNEEACRGLINEEVSRKELFEHLVILQAVQEKIDEINTSSTGSSTYIKRFEIAIDAPSIDVGEITDKGSLNQRVILKHRAHLVAKMYENGN
ncbi:feruloyl-CoA synthase [Sandaracinomonas limnophila]|uniref:Feruloyl-CoA synthase n=1 Tax=Sandaracinomonas limnophila TaxID=1862386 RepID=A0A437PVX5_9BACT|nr:feruloyl-CoA synthase [Sandaracinomonas limnophila]RVU26419.1 feruloyl-CoA synthase [Sandaracinomonas limnophila]